jgi:hypothetical protein
MQTDAHNMGREERRALLLQRRAAVARQLRRLAIELTDLDRQLDEIEQSWADAMPWRPTHGGYRFRLEIDHIRDTTSAGIGAQMPRR